VADGHPAAADGGVARLAVPRKPLIYDGPAQGGVEQSDQSFQRRCPLARWSAGSAVRRAELRSGGSRRAETLLERRHQVDVLLHGLVHGSLVVRGEQVEQQPSRDGLAEPGQRAGLSGREAAGDEGLLDAGQPRQDQPLRDDLWLVDQPRVYSSKNSRSSGRSSGERRRRQKASATSRSPAFGRAASSVKATRWRRSTSPTTAATIPSRDPKW
jgi:hypothetical protein